MERQIIYICMGCQREFPEVEAAIKKAMKDRPELGFSHGLCKRHFFEMGKTANKSDQQIQASWNRAGESKSVDLRAYPELVRQYSMGVFTPEDYKKVQAVVPTNNLKEFFQKRAGLLP